MSKVRVVQGENVWRLVRTDRDAASETEVMQTVGAAMVFFLRSGQPSGLGARTETAFDLDPSSPNVLREWRVGAARPVQLLAVARALEGTPRLPDNVVLPKGKVLGDRFEADPQTLPLVVGERPFYTVVRFWWRAPSVDVPFPLLRVDALGRRVREPVTELDWYLDSAIEPDVKTKDPGDETFVEVVVEDVKDALPSPRNAILAVLGFGAVLAAGYVVIKAKK